MAEVMTRQTELLETIAENMLHRQGGQHNDFQRKLEGFLKLRPPTFDGSDSDPIAAEDWLQEMEKKLDLTTCSDEECVGVAAHQLAGAARAWWDTYCDSHRNPANISWGEFAKEFRDYHAPEGTMDAIADEFCHIKQGSERIQEYTSRFTCMMRYAPRECVVDEKSKMYYFRKGLNTRIKLALSGNPSYTLREMINKTIEIEKDRLEADALNINRKKHRSKGTSRAPPSHRPRTRAPLPPRPRVTQEVAQGLSRGGGTYTANYYHPAPTRLASSPSMVKATASTPTSSVPITCFDCGQPGHRALECPMKKTAIPMASTTKKTRGTPYNGLAGVSRSNLIHLTAEDAQAAPDVVYGMFIVHGAKALVLFESGANCSYISSKFAREHKLPVTPRTEQIYTSSPMGTSRCTHICKGVIITIEGYPFLADLTLLPSEGLDVILGMDG